MNRNSIAASFLLITLLSFGCHKKARKETTETTSKEEVKTEAEVKVPPVSDTTVIQQVKVLPETDMSATGSAYKLDSLVLSGDVLSVFVNYSGGCKDHTFELVSNGMYAKSMPPQLSLCLKHTGNDDMCRKFVMQELKFDIKKFRYPTGNSVTLKLGEQSVAYKY